MSVITFFDFLSIFRWKVSCQATSLCLVSSLAQYFERNCHFSMLDRNITNDKKIVISVGFKGKFSQNCLSLITGIHASCRKKIICGPYCPLRKRHNSDLISPIINWRGKMSYSPFPTHFSRQILHATFKWNFPSHFSFLRILILQNYLLARSRFDIRIDQVSRIISWLFN